MAKNSPDLFCEKFSEEPQQAVGLEDLPSLLSSLNNKDERVNFPQTLRSLIESVLQLIPLSEMEQQLLKYLLPATKDFFFEIILEIDSSLKHIDLQTSDSIADILRLNLQIGLDLLESVNNLIIYLSSLGKMKVSQVSSVPVNVAEILLEVFSHCKSSENKYGEMLPPVRDKLVGLFQKGHQIQISFLSFLHDHLVFVCKYEDDLELLTKVMEHLSGLAEVIEGLDIKSMVEQWKGYTRLAQTYSVDLRLTLNVARPVRFLCNNIIDHVSKILSQDCEDDIKQVRRNVKICSLELKVVIKLCEIYRDYLGDCHQQLLTLLLNLNMCLPSFVTLKNVSSCIADDVGKQLYIGACPLLSHLISDREFFRVYIQFAKNLEPASQEIKVGFLILTIGIIKKLVRIDEDQQSLWLRSLSIVIIVIAALHWCHDILCLDIVIEGDKTVDLYEALLIHTTVLICNSVSSDFFQLEDLLVAQLMKPYIWPAVFVSDLIVLICRFGSNELCTNLTQQMCEVILKCNKDKWCPERIYIIQTTRRLFNLLTANAKLHFLQRYPPIQYPSLWKHFVFTELQKQYCLDLIQKANTDVHQFLNVSSDVKSYNSMVDSLSAVVNCTSLLTSISEFNNHVTSLTRNVFHLWQCIAIPAEISSIEASVNGVQWFYNLYSTLISVSIPCLPLFDNFQLSFVLQCVSDICKAGASSCRLDAVQLLKGLSTTKLTKDQEQLNLFHKISSLFAALMNDNDPLIKTMSLEAFECFSSVTTHEFIVSETVSDDSELQNVVAYFLQRLPLMTTSITEDKYLLSQRSVFKHKCDLMKTSLLDVDLCSKSIQPLSVSQDSETGLVLQRILNDCVSVNEYFKKKEAIVSEQALLKKYFRR